MTPPGAAAIAVVRLTGAGVVRFLENHFNQTVRPGRCAHGMLRDGQRELDDPVVVVSSDGCTADLSLHGGPWVVRSVLDLARRAGFAVDETPGLPLPPEAVDATSELGREVLQYLPLAATELAVRVLLAQEAAWEKWLGSRPVPADVTHVLADRSLHWLLHPPAVAIIGIANVGKSTLANRLFAQERVITADEPGTTRDWVGEIANLDGLAVMLVDTPGVRETQDAIEQEAIQRSREQVTTSDVLVLVLDPTQPREPEQAALEAQYPHALRVVNKIDRQPLWRLPGGAIATVATTGQGVDALREEIRRRFLGPTPFVIDQPRCWTLRQRELVERMITSR
jgi:small GTP-binding protein